MLGVISMIAHLAETFAGLSTGLSIGYAAYVATVTVLAIGMWELDM